MKILIGKPDSKLTYWHSISFVKKKLQRKVFSILKRISSRSKSDLLNVAISILRITANFKFLKMQNNWYAVYTKPHCERKVNSLLTKKNVETYCPLNLKKNRQLFRDTIIREPLFKSYVFVRTSEIEVFKLCKEINGIINLFYWKGKPAIIKDEEINAIMDFTKYHPEISVEKMHLISSNDDPGVSYYMDGQILFVKNRTMKLTLPSLGFTMVAKYEEEGVMGREISFGNKELIVQS